MEWPQWIFVSLLLIGIGRAAGKYGQVKTYKGDPDRYDAIDVIVAPAITFFLLWAGNFFEAGARWP